MLLKKNAAMAAFAASAILAAACSVQGEIDQSTPLGPSVVNISANPTSGTSICFPFTVGITGQLTGINVAVRKFGATSNPAQPLTVSIISDVTTVAAVGSPNRLASFTYTPSYVAPPPFTLIQFTTPVSVTAGQTLGIQFTIDTRNVATTPVNYYFTSYTGYEPSTPTTQLPMLASSYPNPAYFQYTPSTNGSYATGSFETFVTAVPEPTSLGAIGVAGLGLMARRRKAN